MCRKIRCDGESCKVLGFWVHLNKALVLLHYYVYTFWLVHVHVHSLLLASRQLIVFYHVAVNGNARDGVRWTIQASGCVLCFS